MHQFCLQTGGVGDVRHDHDDAIDLALLVAHGAEADGKLSGGAAATEERDFQIIERGALQGALERFGKERPARGRDEFHQRLTQQILFAVAGLEAAAVGVTDQTGGIEHQDHALRVIQNVLVEIALAAVAAFGNAAIGDVFHHVNGAPVVALRVVDARCRN